MRRRRKTLETDKRGRQHMRSATGVGASCQPLKTDTDGVVGFGGIIDEVVTTSILGAQKPHAHSIYKGEVTNYAMDDRRNSCCLVASWSAHPCRGFLHPHFACDCRHCGGSESDSGE